MCGGESREGGKEYNSSHWNVEMCVYKRPVNSCLKHHNTLAWLGKYNNKIERKKSLGNVKEYFGMR